MGVPRESAVGDPQDPWAGRPPASLPTVTLPGTSRDASLQTRKPSTPSEALAAVLSVCRAAWTDPGIALSCPARGVPPEAPQHQLSLSKEARPVSRRASAAPSQGFPCSPWPRCLGFHATTPPWS